LGVIGRAGLATSQQRQAREGQDLQTQLLESQIGLNRSRALAAERSSEQGSELRTQSTRTLANGNIGVVTNDPNNPVIDTGFKEAGKGQIINVPGLGLLNYDPVKNTVTQVAPEDIIREGGAARKGAEQAASTAAQESTQQQFRLPKEIESANAQIRSIDSTLEEAERALGLVSNTSTGIIGNLLQNIPGTDAFTLNKALQPIKSALSLGKLAEMRANSPSGASGLGQVSEKELGLLEDSLVALDQAQNPGDVKRALTKVLTHYNNWKSIIARHRSNLEGQQSSSVSGFRIVDPNATN
jgi:hypothetical protein